MFEIKITSISRNGQHAICNWLCKQEAHKLNIFENHVFVIDKKINLGLTDAVTYNKNSSKKGVTIKLFENYFDSISENVVILRDPYNWLCSLLHSEKRTKESIELYISKYIDLYKSLDYCKLFINFNNWFCDKSYRKSICESLFLPFNDDGLNDVVSFGNGSSFDQRSLNGNGKKMKVLNRFDFVLEDRSNKISKKEFIDIFISNPLLIQIGEERFNLKNIL